MTTIRKYDIELEKEVYYGGETLRGSVVIDNHDNLRVNSIQVFLRGKAHVDWRVTRAGERRAVKEDQFFVDEQTVLWGKVSTGGLSQQRNDDAASTASVLSAGEHRLPFSFQLPEGRILPGSFESRVGTVRYYLLVLIDIPCASQLQGLKYFTVVGPLIDSLDSQYTAPMSARQQATETSCLCCKPGHVTLEAWLERGSYCCGEQVRLKCDVRNAGSRDVTLVCRLVQTVEYRINKGKSGLIKYISHPAIEWIGPTIHRQTSKKFDDINGGELRVPVMPPTTVGICDPIEIYYSLEVSLASDDKLQSSVQLEFPIAIVTVPHRILSSDDLELVYEPAASHVEGGLYISPEFLMGQVYDGAADECEEVILYRPVYVCCAQRQNNVSSSSSASLSVINCRRLSNGSTLDRQQGSNGVKAPPGDVPMITVNDLVDVGGSVVEKKSGCSVLSASSSALLELGSDSATQSDSVVLEKVQSSIQQVGRQHSEMLLDRSDRASSEMQITKGDVVASDVGLQSVVGSSEPEQQQQQQQQESSQSMILQPGENTVYDSESNI